MKRKTIEGFVEKVNAAPRSIAEAVHAFVGGLPAVIDRFIIGVWKIVKGIWR